MEKTCLFLYLLVAIGSANAITPNGNLVLRELGEKEYRAIRGNWHFQIITIVVCIISNSNVSRNFIQISLSKVTKFLINSLSEEFSLRFRFFPYKIYLFFV